MPASSAQRVELDPKSHLDPVIAAAIQCGPIPYLRDWRSLSLNELTKAEQVMKFAERYLKIPGGEHVGKPLRLEPFQEAFLYSVFDNPHKTRTAILSMARRNSKSFLTAVILLAYVVGPLAEWNVTTASAAQSRDQAGLIFKFMNEMISLSPELSALVRTQPSQKRALGVPRNTEYYSMSADARTGYGRSLKVVVLDESGQIVGPNNDFVSMLRTSQGSYDDPLFITISTQAASDGDYLSVLIDDAIRVQDPHSVVHLYTTSEDFDMLDEEGWKYSNPALGVFRSKKDIQEQLHQAHRIPSQSAQAQNLLLNRRVAQDKLWLSPSVWKENSRSPEIEAFTRPDAVVSLGLDLSARLDLTAAVFSVKDDSDDVHLLPFVFTPSSGLEERAARARAPYQAWVASGDLIAVPGAVIEYTWVTEFLKLKMDELGIRVTYVCFDRWRMADFRQAGAPIGFCADSIWKPIGQGYVSMSPRVDSFEALLLQERVRHGGHPVLTFAAASARVMKDPAGNRKIDKARREAKIDALIASLMATYEITEGAQDIQQVFDIDAIIG
jgi:phage terminase large subunit-like protein